MTSETSRAGFRSGLIVVATLALAAPAATQSSVPATRPAELTDPRDAAWFYRAERVESEQPDVLLDLLGIGNGDVVADIGAGAGFFSLRAAARVGPTGRVLAVDVQPAMIDGLRMMIRKTGRDNIVPILGEPGDPRLPAGLVDHVLLILSYHEFSQPDVMMRHIRRAMAPHAQLLVVEYKAEDGDSRVDSRHRLAEADILREITAAGFRRDRVIDFIPTQHVFIFRKSEM